MINKYFKTKKFQILTLLVIILTFSPIYLISFDKNGNDEDNLSEIAEKKISEKMMYDDLFVVDEIANRGDYPVSAQGEEIFNNPTMGNISVLVIPVNFTNLPNTKTTTELEDRWVGGSNSIKNYYWENSLHQLNISVEILDWTPANGSNEYYANEAEQYPREFYLMDYVIDFWDATIDYNDYDYFYITYSGADGPEDDLLFWPHVWTYSSGGYELGDGRIVNNFGFFGEESIFGALCHEFGHSLGLADYYDTSDSLPSYYYVGEWELMGTGGWNDGGDYPSNLGLFSKMELGWITEDQVYDLPDEAIANVELASINQLEIYPENGIYYGLRMNWTENTFYLFEYRSDEGNDAYLPDNGVITSFIDTTKGSGEGIIEYIGGDNYISDLEGVEFSDDELDSNEKLTGWFLGDQEMSIYVVDEAYNSIFNMDTAEIIVDRFHDRGEDWISNTLDVGDYLSWNITLEVGETLLFPWQTTGTSDFELIKDIGGSNEQVIFKDDIVQDMIEFHVNESYKYQVRIFNQEAFQITVDYGWLILEAPEYSCSIDIPDNAYMINGTANIDIEVTFEIANLGWTEYNNVPYAYFQLDELAENITLSEGLNTKFVYSPFFGNELTHVFHLEANNSQSFTINISYGDFYQNYTSSHIVNVGLDTIPPILTLNHGVQYYTNQREVDIQWTVSELQTFIANFSIYLDDILTYQLNGSATEQSLILPEDEGNYIVRVVATDYDGNNDTENTIYTFDMTSPSITILSEDATIITQDFIIEWDATDISSGIDKFEIWINNVLVDEVSALSNSYEITLPDEDGAYIIKIIAIDRSGNENEAEFTLVLELADDLNTLSENKSISGYPILISIGSAIFLVGLIFIVGKHKN